MGASRRRMRTQALWKVITHIALARGPTRRRHPLAHLGGGLVGEGDGEHLAGLHAPGRQQVGDAVGEHPGLARAGTGDDEQRAALVQHGLALLGVEADEQLLGVGARPGRRGAAVGPQTSGGGLGPGGHTGRVDQRRVGAVVGGGVHVRLVARSAEVEAVEEGAHVGVNPTCRHRPHRAAAPPARDRAAGATTGAPAARGGVPPAWPDRPTAGVRPKERVSRTGDGGRGWSPARCRAGRPVGPCTLGAHRRAVDALSNLVRRRCPHRTAYGVWHGLAQG